MTENSNEDYWTQFVPKNYEMDPKTDELLMGDRLRDGMVVLIEDDNLRADVSMVQKHGSAAGLASAKKYNRWATVSNFQILDNGEISFFAVYQDGVKKQIRQAPGFAWYVKRDSIPEEDPLSQEEAELKEAMEALTETAKHAWSDLVTMLRDSFKSEQEQMDKACSKLRDYSDLKFSKKPENLGENVEAGYSEQTNNMSDTLKLNAGDIAFVKMMLTAIFEDDTKVTLPSGTEITGAEMTRLQRKYRAHQ